eukprot:GHVL01031340.1.p1 GENE.GHVL01031340.1~~GHVL01031340.1.p1  ORF type:complete len:436 (+),score=77.77 GHVL01031340.1:1001-2308(+)
MNQKHLLRFIRRKYEEEGDKIVSETVVDGKVKPLRLRDIFNELNITAYEASIDNLNVAAMGSCFHRFDIFNSKYNPFGQRNLREVFLKSDNHIQGTYLAEITKEVMEDLVKAKYQFTEWRISIHGKKFDEWQKLAEWFWDNNIQCKQVRWLIQVPRLYFVYRKRNLVSSFGELIKNIFLPIFLATAEPNKYEKIHYLLQQVVGFDSVDDESFTSKYTSADLPCPNEWTYEENPPYSYWLFYMYANIVTLNQFRVYRKLSTFQFRPHCGEAGSISHLASAFLLADSIAHGVLLKKSPVLQYLFYISQIGLALSPLSNNALFLELSKSPFCDFFRVGLNVSLSTDDPLMFHYTDEPLVEEYSVAVHAWGLTSVDMCEIARNSVLQSGFEDAYKRHWLGCGYEIPGNNNINLTNVPNIRVRYRNDTFEEEIEELSGNN